MSWISCFKICKSNAQIGCPICKLNLVKRQVLLKYHVTLYIWCSSQIIVEINCSNGSWSSVWLLSKLGFWIFHSLVYILDPQIIITLCDLELVTFIFIYWFSLTQCHISCRNYQYCWLGFQFYFLSAEMSFSVLE